MQEQSAPIYDTISLQREAYGTHERQWFEFLDHGAPHDTPALVFVFVHGGYWRALDAGMHRFVLPALTTLGVGVANLEYRLMPDARMADLVNDVRQGMLSVGNRFANAKIVPIGHSAGAHLALLALRNDEQLSNQCKALISISGVFDLDTVSKSFLQSELHLTPREIEQFSASSAPQSIQSLFIVGANETVFYREAAQAMAASSPLASTLCLSPCHHMNILSASFTEVSPLVPLLRDWLVGAPIPDTYEVLIP